jgi:hypothetical protein
MKAARLILFITVFVPLAICWCFAVLMAKTFKT